MGVFKSTVIAGELAALMSFIPTFGPGRLRVLLGPSFSLTSVRSTLGRSEVNDLGLALGLASRAGYLFTLSGCHHLGAEVGYHVRAYAVTGLSATDHVIVIAATYLWN